ncbi:MAG: glycoside hydrolase family 3 protein, partial [Propionibacteriaceae bacterium]|nr:glycoside hydrolase family 3 protein [Propionibacteriaceae bacterium]
TNSPTPAVPTPSETSTPTPPPPPTCRAEAETLSVAERAGQLVMIGVTGSLDAAERKAITANHLGSVILMGASSRGVKKTASLTRSIAKLGDETGILIAVDQEGGLVQRLKGPGFDTIPAAVDQAKLSPAKLTQRATKWGGQLAAAGVQLNLAPVADVVPKANARANQPVAKLRRGYGSDPAKVSELVGAFIEGMHAGEVGAAVKHFPGLGAVKGNTDFAANVVDSTITADSKLLRPFRDAAAGGVDAVMISSAVYRKIDAKRIATFSPKVIGLLRDWGYDKVVISDDLGVARALRDVPAKQRAVRFVDAGGDLAISVEPKAAIAMAKGLVAEARRDAAFSERLTESAARVLALKKDYGLISCG